MRRALIALALAACGDARMDEAARPRGPCERPRWCVVTERLTAAPRGDILERRGVVLATGDGAARTYPLGKLAAHAIGYTTAFVDADVERTRGLGYDVGQHIGRSGIEAAWENYLRGTPGRVRVLRDAKGRELVGFGHLRAVDPEPGSHVVLTIDAELQRAVEAAIAGREAAVVLVEVDTGRILALASQPVFDLAMLTRGPTAEELEALQRDPSRPFIDRTTTAYAAGDGDLLAFLDAIATREQRTVAEVAAHLGFGARSGLGLNSDRTGRVEDRVLDLTAVQLAMAYATLAAGTRHAPSVVREVHDVRGAVKASFDDPYAVAVPWESGTLDAVRRTIPRFAGTVELAGAGAYAVPPPKRSKRERSHAWFAGFAPADHPEVAIAVLIGQAGDSADAASVARAVVDAWWKLEH